MINFTFLHFSSSFYVFYVFIFVNKQSEKKLSYLKVMLSIHTHTENKALKFKTFTRHYCYLSSFIHFILNFNNEMLHFFLIIFASRIFLYENYFGFLIKYLSFLQIFLNILFFFNKISLHLLRILFNFIL